MGLSLFSDYDISLFRLEAEGFGEFEGSWSEPEEELFEQRIPTLVFLHRNKQVGETVSKRGAQQVMRQQDFPQGFRKISPKTKGFEIAHLWKFWMRGV